MPPKNKNKADHLMLIMIGVSVLAHLLLIFGLADRFRPDSLSVIEMSVKDMPGPSGRIIPRPRMRPDPPRIHEPAVPGQPAPPFAMPAEETSLPPSLMETVRAPAVSADTLSGLSDLFAADSQGLFSKKDYFEMVRMKIEQAKHYPETAKGRMVEGRVTVRFTITSDGQVTALSIVRHSGHRDLDQAALDAVRTAPPFSRPPRALFEGPLHLELTLCFELT